MRGPFWSGTVMLAKDRPAAMKGLTVTVGAGKTNYVVYDLDTLRLAAAWSGEFLEFGNTLTKIEWPPPPSVKGQIAFETAMGPGWASPSGQLDDQRARHQGPLPKNWAHYSGLYVNGDQVVLAYTVGGVGVLESPEYEILNGQPSFTRTFQFEKSAKNVALVLASGVVSGSPKVALGDPFSASFTLAKGGQLTIGGAGLPADSSLETAPDGTVVLKLGKVAANQPFLLSFSNADVPPQVRADESKPADLRKLIHGGTRPLDRSAGHAG